MQPVTSTTTTTTTTTAVPAASAECIAEAPDAYARPYATIAPWNVQVCNLPTDPRNDDWADRFYYFSHYNPYMASDPSKGKELGRHGVMFGLDDDPNSDFSVAVYDAREATTRIRVFQRQGWAGKFSIDTGATIPWNPTWRASTGSDAMMVISDPDTGRQWSLWGVVQSYYGLPANDTQCWNWISAIWLPGGGFQPGVDLCVGGADAQRTADKKQLSDYRTYGGNNPGTRGVGVDRYAMLVTAAEVEAGQIRHALSMPVYNTMTGGTGMVCSAAQLPTAAFGTTCGGAVAPAGNFARKGTATHGCGEPIAEAMSHEAYRRTTLPSGTRFALQMTPAQIEQWLDSRGYTGAKRETARIFATALVNYGWFITDTTCYAADFQVEGGANPETAARWRALGIDDDGRELLWGLITRDRIRTVAPPTNHCTDGTLSTFACPANSATYP